MDIKGLGKILTPNDFKKVEKSERPVRSEEAHDRDPNGQMYQGGEEEKHPPMSDEEFEKALEHLKSLAVVKDHNLRVEEKTYEGKRFVLLLEFSGKVVRRIAEAELWTLRSVKENEKGQILSKTA
jgi:hypothetical protein